VRIGREYHCRKAEQERRIQLRKEVPGHVANRLQAALMREIRYLRPHIDDGSRLDSRFERRSPEPVMSDALPVVYLARHGETAWTISGQHTGVTDLPLTARGEAEAVRLGERLEGLTFAAVLTSPLQRAVRTCDLAGFGSAAEIEPDLVEWNYGAYEGRTTAEIRAERPDWQLFRDGCPGGESPDQIGERADRVVRRVRAIEGNILLFSSGHFLRVFTARWLGLEPGAGRYFLLGTASLSAMGYEHDRSEPVIRLWDEMYCERHISQAQVRGHREKVRR
jgi:broad specificity phosphatase PhoE